MNLGESYAEHGFDEVNKYISKQEWDKIEFNNLEAEFKNFQKKQEKLDKEMSYEHYTKVIKPSHIFFHGQDIYFELPKENCKLYDCYLKLYYNDMNDDILKILENTEIKFRINITIIKISLLVNLFFAKLIGKDIIHGENYVLVPLTIFDLFGNKKLNPHKIKFSYDARFEFRLVLPFNCRFNVELVYSYISLTAKINKYHKSINFIQIYHKRLWHVNGYRHRIPMESNLKFLFFSILPSNRAQTFIYTIKEVKLLINNHPIVYNPETNIMKMEMNGYIFYGISLCPETKDKDSIKHFFDIGIDNYPNYFTGLNIGRFDQIDIEIHTDPPLVTYYDIQFIYFNNNYLENCTHITIPKYSWI